MYLTVENFFHYYFFNTKELPAKDQKKAKICAVVLGIFSCGIIPLFCRCVLYDRDFKIISKNQELSLLKNKVFDKKESPKSRLMPLIRKFLENRAKFKEKAAAQIRLRPILAACAQPKCSTNLPLFFTKHSETKPLVPIPKISKEIKKEENSSFQKISIPTLILPESYSLQQLKTLKISDIRIEAEEFIEKYGAEFLNLKQNEKENKDPATAISDMYLVDLSNLKVAAFTASLTSVHPLVFYFISPLQIPSIDLNELTSEQLHCLFLSKRSVRTLDVTQILSVYKKLKDKKVLNNLKTSQMQNFLNKIDPNEMDRTLFDACFNTKIPTTPISKQPRAAFLMSNLPHPRLMHWSHFFDFNHWSYLSDPQIDKISKPKELNINKTIFCSIFPIQKSETKDRIRNIHIDRIGNWLEFFSEKHWPFLSDAQIDKIQNPEDYGMNKEIFKGMFPLNGLDTSARIKKISGPKILKWMPFFSEKHWTFISDPQLDRINDPKAAGLTKEIFLEMFPLSRHETANRIKNISSSKIHLWLEFFSEGHWSCLSDSQIDKIEDPKKYGMNKKIFAKMFDTSKPDTAKRIFDMEQVKAKKWSEFFSAKHISYCRYIF